MAMIRTVTQLSDQLGGDTLAELARLIQGEYDVSQSDRQLWSMIQRVFSGHVKPGFFAELQERYLANAFINELIFRYYPGERVVKYSFVQALLDNADEVNVFELVVHNKRVDLCRINGSSIGYEIKSELDNLDRLADQVSAYSKVFDYVYVITHEKHRSAVEKLIPGHCGIISYDFQDLKCAFAARRLALRSPHLDPRAQVASLSASDLARMLRMVGQKAPRYKSDRAARVVATLSQGEINDLFKQVLREKYGWKWNFLKANFSKIYPIDIQTFFTQPIDPEIVYSRPDAMLSSMA